MLHVLLFYGFKENKDEYEKSCYSLVKLNYSLFCRNENYQILMFITKYLNLSLDAVLMRFLIFGFKYVLLVVWNFTICMGR